MILRKRFYYLFVLILLSFNGFLFAADSKFSGKKIVVYPPVLLNLDKANSWFADFIQGQLSTDFQEYSDFSVINRMDLEAIMSEQTLAEVNSYALNDDSLQSMEYASLVHADYLVTVKIIGTGDTYSINCNVADVKTSTGVSGAACSFNGIKESEISDGSCVHKISYDLLSKMGSDEKKLQVLNQQSKSNTNEVNANYNLAKGIQAQNEGNVVEALVFYNRAKQNSVTIQETEGRLNVLNDKITGASIKNAVTKDIQLRKEWAKIWDEFKVYLRDNLLQVYYTPDLLQLTDINYSNRTVTIMFPVFIRENAECWQIYYNLLSTYNKVSKRDDWKIDTRCQTDTLYNYTFEIKNEAGRTIAKKSCKTKSVANFGESYWLEISSVSPEEISDKVFVNVETNCKNGLVMEVPGLKLPF